MDDRVGYANVRVVAFLAGVFCAAVLVGCFFAVDLAVFFCAGSGRGCSALLALIVFPGVAFLPGGVCWAVVFLAAFPAGLGVGRVELVRLAVPPPGSPRAVRARSTEARNAAIRSRAGAGACSSSGLRTSRPATFASMTSCSAAR